MTIMKISFTLPRSEYPSRFCRSYVSTSCIRCLIRSRAASVDKRSLNMVFLLSSHKATKQADEPENNRCGHSQRHRQFSFWLYSGEPVLLCKVHMCFSLF